MNRLDDPATYKLDVSGMFRHIETLGHELVEAWRLSEGLDFPVAEAPASIVVAAMGGSAAAADYFAEVFAGHCVTRQVRIHSASAQYGAKAA